MKSNSRIRFNPVTKEIEVEGSELFVKTYFDKLQAMIFGPAKAKVKVKRVPQAVKAAPAKKAEKEPKAIKAGPPRKIKKATKKEPGVKRVTNVDVIVRLIQGSTEGISTVELKEKTGFSETQIWGIVNRVKKMGKIKQAKRGVYVAV
jgi:hypothetical protein